jgi:hypothetical protein
MTDTKNVLRGQMATPVDSQYYPLHRADCNVPQLKDVNLVVVSPCQASCYVPPLTSKYAPLYSILKHYLFSSLHMIDQISQLYKTR